MASGVDGTVKENVAPYNPIPGATVTVVYGNNPYDTTDTNGKYNILHPDGTYTIRAEALGYASKEKTVTIPANDYAHAHFKLNSA